MSNGNITLDQAVELFKGKPVEEQLALIYTVLHNQAETCTGRLETCDDRFMGKSWFKTKVALWTGFSFGSGMGAGKIFKHFF